MSESYELALRSAEVELATCDAEADKLERKRAQLRQIISDLKSLLGMKLEIDESLTSAVLGAAKATDGFVTAAQVMDRLVLRGFQVQTTTVATILSRLAKSGQLLAGRSVEGTGYRWEGSASERLGRQVELSRKIGKRIRGEA
jgi:hypothetical protein